MPLLEVWKGRKTAKRWCLGQVRWFGGVNSLGTVADKAKDCK